MAKKKTKKVKKLTKVYAEKMTGERYVYLLDPHGRRTKVHFNVDSNGNLEVRAERPVVIVPIVSNHFGVVLR